MDDAKKVERFGYDPNAGLKFIGTTEKSYPYLHPNGNIYSGKFEFHYNLATGDIDVCHYGCNGTLFKGQEKSDMAVFNVPDGYPLSGVFETEFKILRDAFLKKQY